MLICSVPIKTGRNENEWKTRENVSDNEPNKIKNKQLNTVTRVVEHFSAIKRLVWEQKPKKKSSKHKIPLKNIGEKKHRQGNRFFIH